MFETTQNLLHESRPGTETTASRTAEGARDSRYGAPARWLHWLSAAVILWALASGLAMAAGTLAPAPKAAVTGFNVAITTAFLPIFLLRIAWALVAPHPGPLTTARKQRLAARIGHLALYATTSVVLVSGVLMMDRPIDLFGLATLPRPLTDDAWCQWFAGLHRDSCAYLTIFLALHLAAVAWHQLRGRRVLQRML